MAIKPIKGIMNRRKAEDYRRIDYTRILNVLRYDLGQIKTSYAQAMADKDETRVRLRREEIRQSRSAIAILNDAQRRQYQ